MLNSKRLYLYRLITGILPETSCFRLKRFLLRWAGAVIGENTCICSSVMILGIGELIIGNKTWIGPKTIIIAAGQVTIGNNVDIAPEVYLGTGTHKINTEGSRRAGDGLNKPITIGDGCWLCARSVILAGVSIGPMSIVGAGAVVNRDLPEKITAVGVPAKILKQ